MCLCGPAQCCYCLHFEETGRQLAKEEATLQKKIRAHRATAGGGRGAETKQAAIEDVGDDEGGDEDENDDDDGVGQDPEHLIVQLRIDRYVMV